MGSEPLAEHVGVVRGDVGVVETTNTIGPARVDDPREYDRERGRTVGDAPVPCAGRFEQESFVDGRGAIAQCNHPIVFAHFCRYSSISAGATLAAGTSRATSVSPAQRSSRRSAGRTAVTTGTSRRTPPCSIKPTVRTPKRNSCPGMTEKSTDLPIFLGAYQTWRMAASGRVDETMLLNSAGVECADTRVLADLVVVMPPSFDGRGGGAHEPAPERGYRIQRGPALRLEELALPPCYAAGRFRRNQRRGGLPNYASSCASAANPAHDREPLERRHCRSW